MLLSIQGGYVMSKKEKILSIIVVILLIALVIMTALFINMRKSASDNLEYLLQAKQENSELYKKYQDLEESINVLNTSK
jgi:flagellar basal body-associated protein FliL